MKKTILYMMKALPLLGKIVVYIFSVILLLTILYVFTLCLIDLFIFESDPSQIGPIGDTFGGLLSPIIGLVSIYFIYKTFEAQREQLRDQREQYEERRITDIIYIHLDIINRTISSQNFKISGISHRNTVGYIGYNLFMSSIKQRIVYAGGQSGVGYGEVDRLVFSNANQLIEIFDSVLTAAIIVEDLLKDSNLRDKNSLKLRKLLILSLGEFTHESTEEIKNFAKSYIERKDSQDIIEKIWPDYESLYRLKKSVDLVYTFFKSVLEDSLKENRLE